MMNSRYLLATHNTPECLSVISNMNKWLDRDDNPTQPPLIAKNAEEVLKYYASIYNNAGDGSAPPVISFAGPENFDPGVCMMVKASSLAAGKRNKEQLLRMRHYTDFEIMGKNLYDTCKNGL